MSQKIETIVFLPQSYCPIGSKDIGWSHHLVESLLAHNLPSGRLYRSLGNLKSGFEVPLG